ncbi:hypothetical protein CF319_g3282 [Tilletia indica]|nr:hypothetical protein CF319_g3282 [Tilletia indica]
MNPNQQQQQGGGQGGAGGGGPPGGSNNYARQMMQAQQAAMRQVQAHQHQPQAQAQQPQQQQHMQGGLPSGMGVPGSGSGQQTPGAQGGAGPAPGLDANALATIQSAIQGAVNDPARMQNLLSNLVASGRINPTQLAQIRAMLARNSQGVNMNAQRPPVPVQQQQQQQQQQGLAPPPQVMAPPQQAGQASTAAGSMLPAASQSVAAGTPAARLAQIESELRNEAAVNSEANAAADHVSQRLSELDSALGALQPGTDAHNRISQQRAEEQGKLAHVGSRFMEAKKYYDDLRAQRAAIRVALGQVGNPAVAATAASNNAAAIRGSNGSPAPGGNASPAPNAGDPQTGALNAATNAALAPPPGAAPGTIGISPSKVDLSSSALSTIAPVVNPNSLMMGADQNTAAGNATGSTSGAGAGDSGSNQGNRPMIPVPQTGNRIEVTPPSITGEAFPASRGPRPTLNQGLAAPNPVVATPATLSRPNMSSASGFGASGSGSGTAIGGGIGTGGGSSYISAGANSFGPGSLVTTQENRLLNKRKLQELVGEIDSGEQLEGDVEDLLLEIADEFIESVTHFACKLAKHRRAEKLEVKDVQLHLERNWNIRVPFPGSMPIPPPRTRAAGTTGKGGTTTNANAS